ncbi:MAG: ABC transporter permease [Gammaproteobacteria bacterium]|nr:MAG: ABC transporter permease [Gammaproteobacteria bacterium]RLA10548.1 MAG: ABC transporter permease [Gammaproteobacteria bacterium]
MIRRFLALLQARNMEFLRDRSSLGWNIAFPILLVFGLALIFSDGERALFKVGVLTDSALSQLNHPFLNDPHIEFFTVADEAAAVRKVRLHKIDLLLDPSDQARYWLNPQSQKGHFLEIQLLASSPGAPERVEVTGKPIRLIDWLMPGILGMNMMFSCLFGVGYIVVRYRKSGFLKRLNATPTRAIEFLAAQVFSRLLLIMVLTAAVFVGTDLILDFRMEGSYLLLFATASLGAMALIALGLMISARVSSEELAGGLLNFVTWPMMVLSDVFFSMEGSHPFMVAFAKLLPLTQLMQASRAIMLEGAGVAEVLPQLITLAAMTVVFLLVGAYWFRWRGD